MKLLKELLFVARSFFPRRLPIGMKSLDKWVTDVLRLSGLDDTSKNRQVATSFIFSIKPNVGYISIRSVSNVLVKAAANQVAAESLRAMQGTNEAGPESSPKEVG